MTEHNDGGRAFPMGYHRDGNSADHQGMTLREWYAGLAMQGLLAAGPTKSENPADPEDSIEHKTRHCVRLADALIEELKK